MRVRSGFAMRGGRNPRGPLELPDESDVEAAWTALVDAHPALAPGRASLRFARNGDYAEPTTRLAEGDEVAMIPPVSGGAGTGPTERSPRPILELRAAPFSAAILGELADRLAVPEDGAVVGFLGRTASRLGRPPRDRRSRRPATPASGAASVRGTSRWRMLARIADEVETRYGVERLAIVHRAGEVPLGDVSVAIVVASPHRDEAFDAARYAMDETKARVPIWKAERFADGRVWVGEPARDGPVGEEPARDGAVAGEGEG
jgi:molybdopterin synthase catalytic subunit